MAIYWGRDGGRQGLFSCGARCFEEVSKGHAYACLQVQCSCRRRRGPFTAAAGLNYRVAEFAGRCVLAHRFTSDIRY